MIIQILSLLPLAVLAALVGSVPPPIGYARVPVAPDSFGAWLREFPVREGSPPVYLYDGRLKANQSAHYAVLDIDVGDRDLQQCADAVIRLRAEYLFTLPCRDEIVFDFTSGDAARWSDWRDGQRVVVSGNEVSWRNAAAPDSSYAGFRRYLDTVFMYAGSASLEREILPVNDIRNLRGGDVFIQGGFPGHAVIVVDVAENAAGDRVFLLAQSYMPAQDIHILKSFAEISPWYRVQAVGKLHTPEWGFEFDDLRRFEGASCEGAVARTDE